MENTSLIDNLVSQISKSFVSIGEGGKKKKKKRSELITFLDFFSLSLVVYKPREDTEDSRTSALLPLWSSGPSKYSIHHNELYRADSEALVASLCGCSLPPVKYFTERHATCHCFPQPVHHQIQRKSSCPCCEPAYTYSKCYFAYFTEIHVVKITFIRSILQLSF